MSHLGGSLPVFRRLSLHVDLFRKGSYEKRTWSVAVCRSVETIEQRGTLPENPESHVGREKEKFCLEYSCWFPQVYISYVPLILLPLMPAFKLATLRLRVRRSTNN